LKVRGRKDHVSLLLDGFRYPLPEVSQRAAEALIRLDYQAALSALVDVLEQPDPRAPVKQKIDNREVTAVRELVRINHHKNCLMCHAPANAEALPTNVLSVPTPLPDRRLPDSFSGYGFRASPDIFVRIDMTYLRQDFSAMMLVKDADPWPEMQRFDFVVRTRVLTPEEAAECEKYLSRRAPPNHAAAQIALRGLTGQTPSDPSPRAWRKLLKVSNRQ
jgi:hypothetical protein